MSNTVTVISTAIAILGLCLVLIFFLWANLRRGVARKITNAEDLAKTQDYGEQRQVLDDLLDFIEETGERFYNEHRRYQLLARTRKILRERLSEQFPVDSTDRSLVTAIINATNRSTAKNFREKYLDIFKDSLEALREGRTDAETMALLEERLLEIDDEL